MTPRFKAHVTISRISKASKGILIMAVIIGSLPGAKCVATCFTQTISLKNYNISAIIR